MDLRDTYKVKMKEYDSAGDEIMARVFDIAQKAVKTINNSIYGVTATGSFRLFNIKLAEAITATGQSVIKSSTYLVNRKMNDVIKGIAAKKGLPIPDYRDIVLTNDTDSIILTVEDIVKTDIKTTNVDEFKKIVKIINDFAQRAVNEGIVDICRDVFCISTLPKDKKDYDKIDRKKFRMYIKNEWVASSGLFLAKKGYALNVVFKEGYPKNDFKVVGLTLKKSSTPKAMQNFLASVVKKILSFASKESIDDEILEEARKLKSYKLEDISCPTSVSGIDNYTHNLPIHVRGAKIFNKYFAKSNTDKIINEKVKYLYVKKWKTEPKLNFEKEYVISVPTNKEEYWDILPDLVEPDYTKLVHKLIFKPIEKMYNALKWDIPNISRADKWSCFDNLRKFKREKRTKRTEDDENA